MSSRPASPPAGRPRGARARRERRAPRADGLATRREILDAAGRLYAEKGYSRTTSKEICVRAGTNMAAVNYHFGSKARLYDEVLVEAHRQIMSLERLTAIADAAADPAAKLHAIVAAIVARAIQPSAPWGVRVVVRELMSPSPHARTLIERAIAPKAGIARRLVASWLGLPESHAAVQRCLALVILPALALVIVPAKLRRTILPSLEGDAHALADDFATYMDAGLRAMRSRYAGAKRASRPRAARRG